MITMSSLVVTDVHSDVGNGQEGPSFETRGTQAKWFEDQNYNRAIGVRILSEEFIRAKGTRIYGSVSYRFLKTVYGQRWS